MIDKKYIQMSGRMKSVAKDKVLAESNSIYDNHRKVFQNTINIDTYHKVNQHLPIRNGANLINPDTVTYGAYLDGGRIVPTNSSNGYTDYIAVNGNNIVLPDNNEIYAIAGGVYDNNYSFLRNIEIYAGKYIYQEGDFYIRINIQFHKGYVENKVALYEKNNTPTNKYIPFAEYEPLDDLHRIVNHYLDETYKYKDLTFVTGQYINSLGVPVNCPDGLANKIVQTPIHLSEDAVSVDLTLPYCPQGDTKLYCAFLDSDKRIIGDAIANTSDIEEKPIQLNVPFGAKIIRTSWNKESNNEFLLKINNKSSLSKQIVKIRKNVEYLGADRIEEKNILWKNGYFINTANGTEFKSDNYKCSEFIDINSAKCVLFRPIYMHGAVGSMFYDKDKKPIASSGYKNENDESEQIVKMKVPEGAAYFRISWKIKSTNDFHLELRDSGLVDKIDKLSADVGDIVYAYSDLEWSENMIIAYDSGSTVNAQGNNCTDYINVKGSKYLKLTLPITTGAIGCYFYDVNKKPIIGYRNTSGNLYVIVSIPAEAVYFRTSWGDAQDNLDNFRLVSIREEGIHSQTIDNSKHITLLSENTNEIEANFKSTVGAKVYKEDIFTIDNYFIISENGIPYKSSIFKCTDFIPINDAVSILLTLPYTTGVTGAFFYNIDKEPIPNSGVKNSIDESESILQEITVPQTAKFIRTSWRKDSSNKFRMEFRYDGAIGTAVDNVTKDNALLYSEIGIKIFTYNDLEWEEKKVIGYDSGIAIPIKEKYNCTDYINIEGYKYIKLTLPQVTGGAVGCHFYDVNKMPIVGYRNTSDNLYVIINIPENALYFRTTWKGPIETQNDFKLNLLNSEGLFNDLYNKSSTAAHKKEYDTEGQGNAIKRIRQYQMIKWTPKRFVPSTDSSIKIGASSTDVKVSITGEEKFKNLKNLFILDGTYHLSYELSTHTWKYNSSTINIEDYGISVQDAEIKDGTVITINYSSVLPIGMQVFPINTEQAGIPYASTKDYAYTVGCAVGFKTFMTALHNPNSKMYTYIPNSGFDSDKTFYGGVCSTLHSYCFDQPQTQCLTSAHNDIIGLSLVKCRTAYDLKKLQPGDIVYLKTYNLYKSSHVATIGDIEYDKDNNVSKIEVIQSTPPITISKIYNVKDFIDWYLDPKKSGYDKTLIYRYDKEFLVPYIKSEYVDLEGEETSAVKYNENISIDRGEESYYRVGETVQITIYNKNFPNVSVRKMVDRVYQEVSNIETSVFTDGYGYTFVHDIDNLPSGDYCVVATNGVDESEPVEFSIVDFGNLTVNQSEYTATYNGYSENIEPYSKCVCSGYKNKHVVDVIDLTKGEKKRKKFKIQEQETDRREIVNPLLAIMFKYRFGYAIGNYVPFEFIYE